MNRVLCKSIMLAFLAVPAAAQDSGVPAGVLIYDAVPASPAPAPTIQTVPSTPATTFTLAPTPGQPIQSLASTRSSIIPPPVVQPVANGTLLDPATVRPQVTLAPGETVLRAIAVSPSIVQIPNPQPAYTVQYEPSPPRVTPPPKRDPVTGRLRDTPGWTGRRDRPASIGCFPAGACAVLNAR